MAKSLYTVSEPIDIVTLYEQSFNLSVLFKDGTQRKNISGASFKFEVLDYYAKETFLSITSDSVDDTKKITLESTLGDAVLDLIKIKADFIGTSNKAPEPLNYTYRLSYIVDGVDFFALNGKFIVLESMNSYYEDGLVNNSSVVVTFTETTVTVEIGDASEQVELARALKNQTEGFKNQASTSAANALTSEQNALASEQHALISEQNALASATLATQKADLIPQYLGIYNVATNTPTLNQTPPNGFPNGSYYLVTVGGNIGFVGNNFASGDLVNIGDKLIIKGNRYDREPFAVMDNTITANKTTFVLGITDNSLLIDNAYVLRSGKVLFYVKSNGDIYNNGYNTLSTKVSTLEPIVYDNQTKVAVISNMKVVTDNSLNIFEATVYKSGKVIFGKSYDSKLYNGNIQTIETTLSGLTPVQFMPNKYGIVSGWIDQKGKCVIGIKGDNTVLVQETQEYQNWQEESEAKLILSDKLYLIDDRYLQLYGQSMLANLNNRVGEYEIALQSINSKKQPFQSIFQKNVIVEASKLGTTANIVLKTRKDNDFEVVKSVTIEKSSATKSVSANVLLIGDSLTGSQDNATVDAVADILAQYPVTITFLGKRKLSGVTQYSEGRAGWGITDFIYQNTRFNPLAVGSEGGYTNTDTRNPFIRVSTGSDPSGNIKNGYVFDFNFYRTRFSIPQPKVVIIEHVTNDNAYYPSQFSVWLDAYRIVIESILADTPTCKIGIVLPIMGWANRRDKNLSYTNFKNVYTEFFRQLYNTYKTNANVELINAHAYLTTDYIFPTNSATADMGTKGQINDPVHFVYTQQGRYMFAEPIANFIHSKI